MDAEEKCTPSCLALEPLPFPGLRNQLPIIFIDNRARFQSSQYFDVMTMTVKQLLEVPHATDGET